MPEPQRLVDSFGRVFDYLRVAVIERCNLRCIYCMPEQGVDFRGRGQLIDSPELLRAIRVAAKLGVRKVRFTGGEPLLREDIVSLVEQTVRTPGIESVHLTTNGVLLGRFAEPLRQAGLVGLNASLDTLDPQRYRTITRRSGLEQVLQNVRLALRLGFRSVKINVVAMRGFNDDELPAFAELTREQPITVRFIELMPFDAHQVWKRGRFFGAHRIIEVLRGALPHLQDAGGSTTEEHVFRGAGYAGKLAVIPAFTRSLCRGCSRIRLTADGQIRNCLYSNREFNLRRLLREGASDQQVAELFVAAMSSKLVDGWAAQKEGAGPIVLERTSMTQIGG